MTTLDALIAAAQRRQHQNPKPIYGPTGSDLASFLTNLLGADVLAAMDHLTYTDEEPVITFCYHQRRYSLTVMMVGVVLTRHDPPMEDTPRPRPYAKVHRHWTDGEAPGRDWFLLTLQELEDAR